MAAKKKRRQLPEEDLAAAVAAHAPAGAHHHVLRAGGDGRRAHLHRLRISWADRVGEPPGEGGTAVERQQRGSGAEPRCDVPRAARSARRLREARP